MKLDELRSLAESGLMGDLLEHLGITPADLAGEESPNLRRDPKLGYDSKYESDPLDAWSTRPADHQYGISPGFANKKTKRMPQASFRTRGPSSEVFTQLDGAVLRTPVVVPVRNFVAELDGEPQHVDTRSEPPAIWTYERFGY